MNIIVVFQAPGMKNQPGFNADMGDKGILWRRKERQYGFPIKN
jgi:hypothetical protein